MEELPNHFKYRQDELIKENFSVYLPLRWMLLISVDSCAEWGWPDTLGTIPGGVVNVGKKNCNVQLNFCFMLLPILYLLHPNIGLSVPIIHN